MRYCFLTGGIYGLWRIHIIARDVNLMCKGDGKNTGGFLKFFFLGLITLCIYITLFGCICWGSAYRITQANMDLNLRKVEEPFYYGS
ncbi:DUF4234 domain-containing protein [Breznakiellaceae bacterium SP9]